VLMAVDGIAFGDLVDLLAGVHVAAVLVPNVHSPCAGLDCFLGVSQYIVSCFIFPRTKRGELRHICNHSSCSSVLGPVPLTEFGRSNMCCHFDVPPILAKGQQHSTRLQMRSWAYAQRAYPCCPGMLRFTPV
jgi:hypothetical protein